MWRHFADWKGIGRSYHWTGCLTLLTFQRDVLGSKVMCPDLGEGTDGEQAHGLQDGLEQGEELQDRQVTHPSWRVGDGGEWRTWCYSRSYSGCGEVSAELHLWLHTRKTQRPEANCPQCPKSVVLIQETVDDRAGRSGNSMQLGEAIQSRQRLLGTPTSKENLPITGM